MPTTSGSHHTQTVRSSSSSSSHHASTSEFNDAPGPSTSCPGSIPEITRAQRLIGSSRTATEGNTFTHTTLYTPLYFYSVKMLSSCFILHLKNSLNSFIHRWWQTRFVRYSSRKYWCSNAQTTILLSAAFPLWRPLSWSPVPEPLPFKLFAGVIITANQRFAAQPRSQQQQCSPLPPPCPSSSTTASGVAAIYRAQLLCGEAQHSATTMCWSQQ